MANNATKLLRWAIQAFHKDFENTLCYEEFPFVLYFLFFSTALANSEEVFTYVLDHKVEGALVDVHGLKHHIVSLTQHNIQVINKILDRCNLTPNETIKTKDVTK